MPWKEVSIMSQRLEFVTLATAENANIRHLCRCFGISPGTAYKWLDRFQSAGVNGLGER
jgi:transposase-like protein